MNQRLIVSLTCLTIILTACASRAPQAAPEPASATLQEFQSTPTPPATETLPPIPTDTSVPFTEIPASSVSFAKDVMPIFEASCVKCHGVEQIKEGLNLRTYEDLMAGSFNGPVLVPGNAAESFLVQQLIEGEMPKRGPKLPAEQIQIISDWVDTDAMNN